MREELYHHGIQGQKWGIRRFQNKDGSLTSAGKKRLAAEGKPTSKKEVKKSFKKSSNDSKGAKKESLSDQIKKMSDDEIRQKINRIENENKLMKLMTPAAKEKSDRGKKFVMDILEGSAKNIGQQTVTYLMGQAVNKMAGSEIVNPKKGQKDK